MLNAILIFLALHAVQSPVVSEFDAVVRRATEYVTQYEAQLGNLIGTEEYIQAAVSGPNVGWGGATPSQLCQASRIPGVVCPGSDRGSAPRPVTRRTSSDFMMIDVGGHWNALRNVHQVDGKDVKGDHPSLDLAFDDTPANNAKRVVAMKADSTEYNVGNILREANLPTFALQVLRKDQVSRFVFERNGSEKINGVQTWRIKFRETAGAALVVNENGGENLYSTGTLWVEPETGRVLKTQFLVDNKFVKPAIASTVVVTYAEEKKLQMLVPQTMTEHYERIGEVIDCQADYSNFHRFNVETHFDFGAPPKPEAE